MTPLRNRRQRLSKGKVSSGDPGWGRDSILTLHVGRTKRNHARVDVESHPYPRSFSTYRETEYSTKVSTKTYATLYTSHLVKSRRVAHLDIWSVQSLISKEIESMIELSFGEDSDSEPHVIGEVPTSFPFFNIPRVPFLSYASLLHDFRKNWCRNLNPGRWWTVAVIYKSQQKGTRIPAWENYGKKNNRGKTNFLMSYPSIKIANLKIKHMIGSWAQTCHALQIIASLSKEIEWLSSMQS